MEGFHPSHLSTMLSRLCFLQYAGQLSHKKLVAKAYHEFLKGSKPRRRLRIVFVQRRSRRNEHFKTYFTTFTLLCFLVAIKRNFKSQMQLQTVKTISSNGLSKLIFLLFHSHHINK